MKTLPLLLFAVLLLAACSNPVVVIDQGHQNEHRADKTLRPLLTTLEDAGYNIAESHGGLAPVVLEGKTVLVVATGDGFKDDEITLIEQWVRDGGSLLLAANQAPSPSLRKLGSRFGVELGSAATKDHGKGRVAVLADTTLLSKQRGGDQKRALDVVNWLSREGSAP